MSRIVVLGGGESGVGSAVLAKVKGFDVFLSDMGKISEEYASTLKKWDIPFEQGKHSEELILNADEVKRAREYRQPLLWYRKSKAMESA